MPEVVGSVGRCNEVDARCISELVESGDRLSRGALIESDPGNAGNVGQRATGEATRVYSAQQGDHFGDCDGAGFASGAAYMENERSLRSGIVNMHGIS